MTDVLNWGLSGPATLIALVVGYLFGSIPFGIILTKLAGGPDLRSIGSGNIGATNVLRTGNKKLAAATLVGDMLKGTVAVLVGARFLGGPEAALAAGVGAFLGHLFPVWLRFKGGKGVATYLGVLIGVKASIALVFAAIWLSLAYLFRYSSLSALVASALTPLLLWFWAGMPKAALVMAGLTVLLWIMHRENIARLLAGREGKIGQKG
ncbi:MULTISPECIES: glycerol-3-phosphate 1-O-acyltransferase PlsY [Bosea]|uniref:glycerol-3-phosphate 1-O-acyltransferase PlsY n=1 Tax=Bosea TaxID=85413 RepID=UPI0021506237|nr:MULTISPECIES: glycerol-3-phosphate 1-O-acyltransferase PlsY [Bosea]MCR4520546.1 glycerol-3-phosphate 1-O-acyltransferase PlsY [Bosea sp. 47.2.35]MDR6827900.1 glycerol-3-phosphate acyltransferase PlsY [Bosea robiniae]MDR6894406.1 glycerol-3-phosphate acyltransferase PlsY [Bosea sp. BE109]MDR7138006.1 glycerol-3-phosphate acyltransferase PlsY [Bosea sp. BE168]MDR7174705.1 glycerol-3-phosphate acyltransferase PlsY [Bosea sp. BE271]